MGRLRTGSATNLIVAMLAVAILVAGFWILLLGPKREEAQELGGEVETLRASLVQHEAEVTEAEAARAEFPAEYQRLVVLGKAVPGDDDIASLLVQMNRIATSAGGTFRDITLGSGGEAASATQRAGQATSASAASATEVAASLLPLGASVGPAGLAVMPYEVTFDGSFFKVADFINGLDGLVETKGDEVAVDGRLVTIDGFSLQAANGGFPALRANFSLTTYLTPPSEGVTGGATPSSPGSATATPTSATVGGSP